MSSTPKERHCPTLRSTCGSATKKGFYSLNATWRHPYRPAHIHFITRAPGQVPVTMHIFVAGSPYLDSDAVFAVKHGRIVDCTESHDSEAAARNGVQAPFRHAEFDLVLTREQA